MTSIAGWWPTRGSKTLPNPLTALSWQEGQNHTTKRAVRQLCQMYKCPRRDIPAAAPAQGQANSLRRQLQQFSTARASWCSHSHARASRCIKICHRQASRTAAKAPAAVHPAAEAIASSHPSMLQGCAAGEGEEGDKRGRRNVTYACCLLRPKLRPEQQLAKMVITVAISSNPVLANHGSTVTIYLLTPPFPPQVSRPQYSAPHYLHHSPANTCQYRSRAACGLADWTADSLQVVNYAADWYDCHHARSRLALRYNCR